MSPYIRSGSCPGYAPGHGACEAIEASILSWALTLPSGLPVVAWGVRAPSYTSNFAFLWSVFTTMAPDHWLQIGRVAKKVIKDLRPQYEKLIVDTDRAYPMTDRWVRWLGFKEVPGINDPELRYYILETPHG